MHYERIAESSYKSFLQYFHSALGNHLSPVIAKIPYVLTVIDRFSCTLPVNCPTSIIYQQLGSE